MIEELTDIEIDSLLAEQFVGRVGCSLDGVTYVVPVIFAWSDGCAWIYTTEGQKVTMMRANPSVCFEVDERQDGGSWRSVIIQGTYEELSGDDAAHTLALLSAKMPPPPGSVRDQRPRGEGRSPIAFRVRASVITGRKVDR